MKEDRWPIGEGDQGTGFSCGLERSSLVLEGRRGPMVPQEGARPQSGTPAVPREAHAPSMARKQQRLCRQGQRPSQLRVNGCGMAKVTHPSPTT